MSLVERYFPRLSRSQPVVDSGPEIEEDEELITTSSEAILERVVGFSHVPDAVDVNALNIQIKSLVAQKSKLLPVEAWAIKEIDKRIEVLFVAKKASEATVQGYKKLSLEPLEWRDGKGYPVLAIFPVMEEPMMAFLAEQFHTYSPPILRIVPNLPHKLANCYKDLHKVLIKKDGVTDFWQTTSLRMPFEGVIPDSVREKIASVASKFEALYLITEALWTERDQQMVVRDRDPLLVGWSGYDLFLIDKFDVTPLEEYYAQEFPG